MKPLNTIPIENFLEKARIAQKTNQKNLIIDIKDVQSLAECLSLVMTRLVSNLDEKLQNTQNEPGLINVNMDGGTF